MTMLLSDAIRLGAMLKPQGFGAETSDPKGVETCAMGAAAEAAGVPHEYCYEHWGKLGYPTPLIESVWMRNDGISGDRSPSNSRYWTREEIADCVEQWERDNGMRTTPADVKAFGLGLFEDALEEEEREA